MRSSSEIHFADIQFFSLFCQSIMVTDINVDVKVEIQV